jgi:hypothetical protein|uniref:DUF4845 domain-containing protein n=1 Tax=candidate division WOR-3 bacterium TaxID=2052148 RepID=A0A7V3RJ22_UNCW3
MLRHYSKGISGFGIIFLIIFILLICYVGYQIFRIQFTYSSAKNKVEDAVRLGPLRTDGEILNDLLSEFKEIKLQLNMAYDTIFIDRTIPDSFRIYVAYNDSSNIFGFYTYKRHLVIDVIMPVRAGL